MTVVNRLYNVTFRRPLAQSRDSEQLILSRGSRAFEGLDGERAVGESMGIRALVRNAS